MNATELLAMAAHMADAGTAHALVTVVRAEAPTSAHPGDKALVTADGAIHGWIGGGCAQPVVVKTVRRALADGVPRLVRIAASADVERDLGDVLEFGMACHSGGTLELFVDPVLPRSQLLVYGTSPVAVTLAQLAPRVGFSVVVAAEGVDAAQFPDADAVCATDDAKVLAGRLGSDLYVVVATQGRRDLQALHSALALDAPYVAFVASARKAATLKASLRASGADADAVDAIVAPAGYPISASTPEEIALSVLAAVVAQRRGSGRKTSSRAVPAAAADPAPLTAPESTLVPALAEVGAAAEDHAALPARRAARHGCCGG